MVDMTTVATIMEITTATMATREDITEIITEPATMAMEKGITVIHRDHRPITRMPTTTTAKEEDPTTMTRIGIGRTIMDMAATMTGLNRLLPIPARIDLAA